MMKKKVILLSIIALALSSHAFGQSSTTTSSASVTVDNRIIALSNIAGISFGTIMPFSTSGTVAVTTLNGLITENVHVSDASTASISRWEVSGVPGAPYNVTVPVEINISNGTDTMLVNSFFANNQSTQPALGSDGLDTFLVGALLNVNGNQPPGTYTGTFDVTVNYP